MYKIDQNSIPSVSEISSTNFEIYPNPTSGTIYINSDTVDEFKFQITDINGKEIFNTIIQSQFQYSFPKEVSNGIYILRLTSGSENITKKINLNR